MKQLPTFALPGSLHSMLLEAVKKRKKARKGLNPNESRAEEKGGFPPQPARQENSWTAKGPNG